MNGWIKATALTGLVVASHSVPVPQEDGREPPQRFTLEIGDARQAIALDEPFELVIGGEKTEAVLRARETRLFQLDEVEFEYLSFMDFETEGSGPTRSWTLDGNAVVLSVFRFDDPEADRLCESIVNETLEAFGGDPEDIEADRIVVGGAEWEGARFRISVGEVPLQYYFYASRIGARTYVLGVLDSLTDDGETTDEARRTFELLEQTFRRT